jgi:hypothetical protein
MLAWATLSPLFWKIRKWYLEVPEKSGKKSRCSQGCIVLQNINVKYFGLWATQKWQSLTICGILELCIVWHARIHIFIIFVYMYLWGCTQGNHVCGYLIWSITSRTQHYELSQCSCSMTDMRCFSVQTSKPQAVFEDTVSDLGSLPVFFWCDH